MNRHQPYRDGTPPLLFCSRAELADSTYIGAYPARQIEHQVYFTSMG